MGSLLLGLLLFFSPSEAKEHIIIWQQLGIRFVILGMLISETLWCGRMYKALANQAAVNRHRSLVMQTMRAFSTATQDPNTVETIVTSAAKSAFEHIPTGYIDSKSSTDRDVTIFDLVKNFTSKSDSR